MLHSLTNPQGLLKDSSDSSGLLRTPPAVLQQSSVTPWTPQGLLKDLLETHHKGLHRSPQGVLKESLRSLQGVFKEPYLKATK